ncbi:hypothetical protein C8J57DRAFT_1286824, partial [Mycena rebaudengoi]
MPAHRLSLIPLIPQLPGVTPASIVETPLATIQIDHAQEYRAKDLTETLQIAIELEVRLFDVKHSETNKEQEFGDPVRVCDPTFVKRVD